MRKVVMALPMPAGAYKALQKTRHLFMIYIYFLICDGQGRQTDRQRLCFRAIYIWVFNFAVPKSTPNKISDHLTAICLPASQTWLHVARSLLFFAMILLHTLCIMFSQNFERIVDDFFEPIH